MRNTTLIFAYLTIYHHLATKYEITVILLIKYIWARKKKSKDHITKLFQMYSLDLSSPNDL